jgi:uncharacterized membrane protein (UPF0127 family)
MKFVERIVMLLLTFALIFGGAWIYFSVKQEQKDVRDAVARGDYEIIDETEEDVSLEEWRLIYPNTVPVLIGTARVKASVADDLPERIKGLSDTPFLPDDVVKLFVFGVLGNHSIWMKDMNYSIDIIWVSKEGDLVHIEESVSPDSYPASYSSPTPAWYVIEASAGFVEKNKVKIGDKVSLLEG